MAQDAVANHSISIRLACSALSISETCYRYQAKLKDENEMIAHRLIELTEQCNGLMKSDSEIEI